ncbi:MAG: biotin/lipoate A/B protein ligase family protein [bacterium]
MKAYYVPFGRYDVYTNMAIDEYLYKNVSETVLRFYEFSEPSVTIGYNQKYGSRFNLDFVSEKRIPITRRLTGGRAVFHDGDLTYSISADFSCFAHGSSGLDMVSRYKKISDVFLKGFKSMGLDVSVFEGKSLKPFSSNCFDSSSIHELTINGNKILGSAQVFSEKGFMQQGTILVKNGVFRPAELYGENFQKNIEIITSMVYNIKDMAKELYDSFMGMFDYEWEDLQVSITDCEVVKLIDFYKNSEWIKRV